MLFLASDIEWGVGVWAMQARGGPWQVLVMDGETCQLAVVKGHGVHFTIWVEAKGVMLVDSAGREAGPFVLLRDALWAIATIPSNRAEAGWYFADRRLADRRQQPQAARFANRRIAGRRLADLRQNRVAESVACR
jgi:hypothetical protein